MSESASLRTTSVRAVGALVAVALALFVGAGAAYAATQTPPATLEDTRPPSRRLVFSGELGARLEYIANDSFAETDALVDDDARFRQRFRLRFGVDYEASRAIALGFRLSTGDSRFPPSAWASLSNEFRRQPIAIDRAFVSLRPGGGADLRAGVMTLPLFSPTQVVWDTDVQPAGLSEVLPLGSSGLTFAAGQFWLREARSDRPENQEGSLLFAQGLSWTRVGARRRWTAGVAYWHYNRPDALALAIQTGDLDSAFKTNRLDPEGRTIPDPRRPGSTLPVDYFSDYTLLGAGFRVERPSKRSFALSAEGVVNLGARSDPGLGPAYARRQARAFVALLHYGSDREDWDFRVSVGYAHIEADAVVAVYNSDDLQQTNVRSVPVEAVLRLPGGPRLVLDAYVQKKLDVALPGPGGIVSPENATKLRARLSLLVPF